eukprot:TRINITY_DN333_c0_g1_i1.p2 TRINITY_DN333_c0_g1~~TRINITY_DN333_c0_g1_i1.p2  ORF type:complete len:127 (+),score=6.14 TRINITY_DN333_c0_g1_i1:732-1112(+)
MRDDVGATAEGLVLGLHVALDDAGTTDGPEALHDHVVERARQRQLAGQEQTKSNSWVDVTTGDSGGTVNKGEDHAAEGPSDALDAHAVSAHVIGALDAHDGEDRYVKEQKGGHELGYPGPPEGPRF